MGDHNCTQVITKVFLALDGELSSEEEKQFLEELNKCSCCLETYSIEKTFKEFLIKKIERKEIQSNIVLDIKQKIKTLSV